MRRKYIKHFTTAAVAIIAYGFISLRFMLINLEDSFEWYYKILYYFSLLSVFIASVWILEKIEMFLAKILCNQRKIRYNRIKKQRHLKQIARNSV